MRAALHALLACGALAVPAARPSASPLAWASAIARARPSLPPRAAAKDDGFGGERERLALRIPRCASGEEVAEIIELIWSSGMEADERCYRDAIARCAALGGEAEWARLLLDDMAARGVRVDARCHELAISALARAESTGALEQLVLDTYEAGVPIGAQAACEAFSAICVARGAGLLATGGGDGDGDAGGLGALWLERVRPALWDEADSRLMLAGASPQLALAEVDAALDALVAAQLEAGPTESETPRRAVRVCFGAAAAAEAACDAVERALTQPGGGGTPIACTRERLPAARGATRQAGPADGEDGGGGGGGSLAGRGGGGGSVGSAGEEESLELVLQRASLEAWVRARCIERWLAETGAAAAVPAAPAGGAEREARTGAEAPVSSVPGVGPKRRQQLEAAGVTTVKALATLVIDDAAALADAASRTGIAASLLKRSVVAARQLLDGQDEEGGDADGAHALFR